MNQTEPTSSAEQLILKVHNLYKAETDKRIADLMQLINIRDQEIDIRNQEIDIRDKRIESLAKENEDLREVIKEKDDRIDHLTNILCDIPEPAKCKVVNLRPAYAMQ